ncbi:hypothetical protein [Streptomyces sp. NBC_01565]|uniref:hypothetical protein n=1 Tax=unclassified Streptomyces TaxID=2593676 RepID=UPI0022503A04|nr:hypothetical protein [Streptomyces sp. NBC_01565]
MLLGALAMPAAAAHGPDPDGAPVKKPAKGQPAKGTQGKPKPCTSERTVSSAVVDYTGVGIVFEAVFRTATDRTGNAFLNDSRNPGVWIDLGRLAGAPRCAQDAAVSVTEENPGELYITVLGRNGTLYEATCVTDSGIPFTPRTLRRACGDGFTPIPGTPV